MRIDLSGHRLDVRARVNGKRERLRRHSDDALEARVGFGANAPRCRAPASMRVAGALPGNAYPAIEGRVNELARRVIEGRRKPNTHRVGGWQQHGLA